MRPHFRKHFKSLIAFINLSVIKFKGMCENIGVKFTGSLLLGNSFPIPVIPLHLWLLRSFSVSTPPSWDAHIPSLLPILRSWSTKAGVLTVGSLHLLQHLEPAVNTQCGPVLTCLIHTVGQAGTSTYMSIDSHACSDFLLGESLSSEVQLNHLLILRTSHLMPWSS